MTQTVTITSLVGKRVTHLQTITINDLVGKWVVRTKPYIYKNGVMDNSFINDPIKIVNINKDNSFTFKHSFIDTAFTMSNTWNDGNWIECIQKY